MLEDPERLLFRETILKLRWKISKASHIQKDCAAIMFADSSVWLCLFFAASVSVASPANQENYKVTFRIQASLDE